MSSASHTGQCAPSAMSSSVDRCALPQHRPGLAPPGPAAGPPAPPPRRTTPRRRRQTASFQSADRRGGHVPTGRRRHREPVGVRAAEHRAGQREHVRRPVQALVGEVPAAHVGPQRGDRRRTGACATGRGTTSIGSPSPASGGGRNLPPEGIDAEALVDGFGSADRAGRSAASRRLTGAARKLARRSSSRIRSDCSRR